MIGSMPFKKCPACGESNVDSATRCSICGAEMAETRLPGGIEKIDAMGQMAAAQPWEEQKPAPPPAPAAPARPATAAEAERLAQSQAAEAERAAGLNPITILKRHILPPALAITAVFMLVAVGKVHKPAPPPSAQQNTSVDASKAFMSYTLAAGPEKGKTMMQFWSDYQVAFMEANAGKKDAAGMKIKTSAQPSALGGLMFDIFVIERVDGEQGRIYPFRVDLETGEVATATGCVFSPEYARDYAAEKCVPASEVFPEGI